MKAADIAASIKVCSNLFITCWGVLVPWPRLMEHEEKTDRAQVVASWHSQVSRDLGV